MVDSVRPAVRRMPKKALPTLGRLSDSTGKGQVHNKKGPRMVRVLRVGVIHPGPFATSPAVTEQPSFHSAQTPVNATFVDENRAQQYGQKNERKPPE
jgi:hypothetical protein